MDTKQQQPDQQTSNAVPSVVDSRAVPRHGRHTLRTMGLVAELYPSYQQKKQGPIGRKKLLGVELKKKKSRSEIAAHKIAGNAKRKQSNVDAHSIASFIAGSTTKGYDGPAFGEDEDIDGQSINVVEGSEMSDLASTVSCDDKKDHAGSENGTGKLVNVRTEWSLL